MICDLIHISTSVHQLSVVSVVLLLVLLSLEVESELEPAVNVFSFSSNAVNFAISVGLMENL